ncbi:MAG: protoheme IX farnesyltransferase [Desulfuromonas sp.]|nr:MAG: protoheme IX farnesyltransferase [Desulfuromonas sp.]
MPQPLSHKLATPTTALPLRVLVAALRRLFRVELSAMVALSALAGTLFSGARLGAATLVATLATGLLAAGCSALNQWQEQDLDSRMQRTSRRPLPQGLLTPATALWLCLPTIGGGILLLGLLPGWRPLLIGLLAVIWYNGIYTPLKRRTAFAAIPGAVCGALPPLIGWTAAGGQLSDPRILLLAGTLFVWQIPHTWLLYCRYREDLERSGLPNPLRTCSTRLLLRINHSWLMSLGVSYLLFPLFGYIAQPLLAAAFVTGILLLGGAMLKTARDADQIESAHRAFHLVNLSMALLLTTLILDRLFQ